MKAFLTNSNLHGRQAYWMTSMHCTIRIFCKRLPIIVQLHFVTGKKYKYIILRVYVNAVGFCRTRVNGLQVSDLNLLD